MRVAVLALVGLSLSGAARADDGIPPKVLADLKAGTVFIKVQAERGKGTGSGFVVATAGDSALIVTNQHVVVPKSLGAVKGTQVVFHSGKPGSERTLDATVLVADAEQDLAVLQVAGAKELPKPIDIASAVEVSETMTVYSLGFPFGEALSTTKGNPTLTVGQLQTWLQARAQDLGPAGKDNSTGFGRAGAEASMRSASQGNTLQR